MKIVFTLLSTGEILDDPYFFVMNNEVWCGDTSDCELYGATVSFEDFIVKCSHIGWGVEGAW